MQVRTVVSLWGNEDRWPWDWQSSTPVLGGSEAGVYIIHQAIHLFCVILWGVFGICVLFYNKLQKKR